MSISVYFEPCGFQCSKCTEILTHSQNQKHWRKIIEETSQFPVHDGSRAKLKFCVKAEIKTCKFTLKGRPRKILMNFSKLHCIACKDRIQPLLSSKAMRNSRKSPCFIWLESGYFNLQSRQVEVLGPSSKMYN